VEPITVHVWLISCAKWSREHQIHEIQKRNECVSVSIEPEATGREDSARRDEEDEKHVSKTVKINWTLKEAITVLH
jgi:hypothetical protein